MRFFMGFLAAVLLASSAIAAPDGDGTSARAFLREMAAAKPAASASPRHRIRHRLWHGHGRRIVHRRHHVAHYGAYALHGAIRSLVARAAQRHGVPVALALGVAHVESGFRPRWNGIAAGVMQIRPATARSVGCSGKVRDLMRPAYGVECGMRYLAQVWHHAGSRYRTAALYTQGIGARRVSRAGARYARMVLAARPRQSP